VSPAGQYPDDIRVEEEVAEGANGSGNGAEAYRDNSLVGSDAPDMPERVGLDLITPAEAVGTEDLDAAPAGGEAQTTGGIARQIFRVFLEHKLAVVSLCFIILMILFCWVGPFLYHSNQTTQATALLTPENLPPGATGHPLGTNNTGFDVLGRLMYGGQTSLLVGLLSAAVATVVGVIWGAVSGFLGRWLDAVMMRIVDIVLSMPVLFLLIALVSIFHSSETLLILVIAGVSWLIPARLVRGETLSLRTREYVQAVKAMGGRGPRIIGRHIIPNAVGTIVVFATFQVATSILILAALGFLGFGLPPPGTDWGSMLSAATNSLGNGWWWEVYPVGVCIVLVVIAFNFVGDALRDALEVRTQRR
jgi:peptide/nickel transport system permease protein